MKRIGWPNEQSKDIGGKKIKERVMCCLLNKEGKTFDN